MSYPALRHIARRWDRSWHYTACCVCVSWEERGLQFLGLSVQYSSDALITVLEHNQLQNNPIILFPIGQCRYLLKVNIKVDQKLSSKARVLTAFLDSDSIVTVDE